MKTYSKAIDTSADYWLEILVLAKGCGVFLTMLSNAPGEGDEELPPRVSDKEKALWNAICALIRPLGLGANGPILIARAILQTQ